jgi:hypothetical protein
LTPFQNVPSPHDVQLLGEILPAGDVKPAEHEPHVLGSAILLDDAPARAYFPIGHVTVPLQELV